MNEKKVLAVTITYNPVISDLLRQIDALLLSQTDIFIVDNGSVNIQELEVSLASYSGGVTLMKLGQNLGIAAAQNHGIRRATEEQYPYILLMDQDSLPADDMVSELLKGIALLPDAAAVGPNFIDNNHASRARFIKVQGFRIIRMTQETGDNIVEVDHLIASGSLIPVRHFAVTGSMDESLFIDYVDIEWALRARAKGLRSYGIFSAKMHHALGNDHIDILGRKVAVHSAQRHYYMVRNAVLLYKKHYIPTSWKVVDACKLVAKMLVLLAGSQCKMENAGAIIRGLKHGIFNRSGKCVLK